MQELTIKEGHIFLDGKAMSGVNRFKIKGDIHNGDKVELLVSMTVRFGGYEVGQQSEAAAPKEKKVANDINAKIVNMIILGYSCLRISEETGCSYGYIRSIAKTKGLRLNDADVRDQEEDDGK